MGLDQINPKQQQQQNNNESQINKQYIFINWPCIRNKQNNVKVLSDVNVIIISATFIQDMYALLEKKLQTCNKSATHKTIIYRSLKFLMAFLLWFINIIYTYCWMFFIINQWIICIAFKMTFCSSMRLLNRNESKAVVNQNSSRVIK